MPNRIGPVMLLSVSSALALCGCTTGAVKLADKDTSGKYQGLWVATIDEPRSSRVSQPGNWFMTCRWDPYQMGLDVADGMLTVRGMEGTTPVSSDGEFYIEVQRGEGRMSRGVLPGNARFTHVFSGRLEADGSGEYSQYLSSIGAAGCNAPMEFEKR